MKTFTEWIDSYLENDLVLFPDTARTIKDIYMSSPVNKAMSGRWNDTMQGYPPQLLSAMKIHLNTEALRYLREHMPEHFMIRYLEMVSL